MKKRLKILITLIIVLIIIAIVIIVLINNQNSKNKNRNELDDNTLEQIEQNALIENLADMTELNRVQTYFGEFLEYIESENYSEAYNHLNENFKNKYFGTLEKFTNYVKTKYPKNLYVKYPTYERQGEVYILTVTIGEIFNENFAEFEQRVVIRENGANQYTISLQLEENEINNNEQSNNVQINEEQTNEEQLNEEYNNNQIVANILVSE